MTSVSDQFQSPNTLALVGELLKDSILNWSSTGTAKDLLLMVTVFPSHCSPIILSKKYNTITPASTTTVLLNNPTLVIDNKNFQNNDNITTSHELSQICFNMEHTLMSKSASSSTSGSR